MSVEPELELQGGSVSGEEDGTYSAVEKRFVRSSKKRGRQSVAHCRVITLHNLPVRSLGPSGVQLGTPVVNQRAPANNGEGVGGRPRPVEKFPIRRAAAATARAAGACGGQGKSRRKIVPSHTPLVQCLGRRPRNSTGHLFGAHRFGNQRSTSWATIALLYSRLCVADLGDRTRRSSVVYRASSRTRAFVVSGEDAELDLRGVVTEGGCPTTAECVCLRANGATD